MTIFETSRIKGLAERVAVPAKIPQYRGVGLAYRGDGKWIVGFAHRNDEEDFEWLDGLTFDEALSHIEAHEKHFIMQSDEAVFGVQGR